jgi:hypothetical protein
MIYNSKDKLEEYLERSTDLVIDFITWKGSEEEVEDKL